MITPADIDNMQFSTTRLKEGYDQDEVDDFLDRVSVEYKKLQDELAKALEDNRSLRRQVDSTPTAGLPVVPAEPPSAVAEKLLKVADETAKQHVAEAQAKADEMVREAGGQGARIVEESQDAAAKVMSDARDEAERIKNDGYAEKYKKFEALETRHNQVADALTKLEARAEQLKASLSAALDDFNTGVANA